MPSHSPGCSYRPARCPSTNGFVRSTRRRWSPARPARSAGLDTLATVAAALPTSVITRLARQQGQTIDFATSNVKGSPVPMYVAGAQLIEIYPIGPLGGVAFNLTLMSYLGSLDMALNIDTAAVDRARTPGVVPRSFVHGVGARVNVGSAAGREQRADVEQEIRDLAGRHELTLHHLGESSIDHADGFCDHGRGRIDVRCFECRHVGDLLIGHRRSRYLRFGPSARTYDVGVNSSGRHRDA